ncbi:MAG TPA: hypothetical protein IAD19_05870 [Candidatus Egerieicola faecale]|uniref:Uncharacterized protein n=1 Tax=Candidatus Egerieicola faecale TaxID=2840774 RepID=A0A9D1IU38_9FIRM|nr:hypothetical protein [Candidatus Egerieicola faecale]
MVYPPALVLCNFATTYHSFYTTFFPTFQPKPPHRAELPRKKGRSRKNHSQLFFDKNTAPLPVSGKGGCIGFYGKGLSLPFFPRQPAGAAARQRPRGRLLFVPASFDFSAKKEPCRFDRTPSSSDVYAVYPAGFVNEKPASSCFSYLPENCKRNTSCSAPILLDVFSTFS